MQKINCLIYSLLLLVTVAFAQPLAIHSPTCNILQPNATTDEEVIFSNIHTQYKIYCTCHCKITLYSFDISPQTGENILIINNIGQWIRLRIWNKEFSNCLVTIVPHSQISLFPIIPIIGSITGIVVIAKTYSQIYNFFLRCIRNFKSTCL